MIYLVSYDLGGPDRDYGNLIEKIKANLIWANPLKSLWLVRTNLVAAKIKENLRGAMDRNDKLLVVQVGADWDAVNVDQKVLGWMTELMT